MSKIIIQIINILFCGWVLTTCLIVLAEFATWQEKAVGVVLTLAGARLIALIMNRFLSQKIGVLNGIFGLLTGPLLVTGTLFCFEFPAPWPLKIMGMVLWVIVLLYLPSLINRH
ncbi:hypothetical protein [Cronobacter sakazakii]|uniref:hypothetical protein n=1 Tax=Cronobacter sakazakii TaxID=28141 RepID=UPI000CFB0E79|nr:hypothetical protein [Cronobacter sakazakii]